MLDLDFTHQISQSMAERDTPFPLDNRRFLLVCWFQTLINPLEADFKGVAWILVFSPRFKATSFFFPPLESFSGYLTLYGKASLHPFPWLLCLKLQSVVKVFLSLESSEAAQLEDLPLTILAFNIPKQTQCARTVACHS